MKPRLLLLLLLSGSSTVLALEKAASLRPPRHYEKHHRKLFQPVEAVAPDDSKTGVASMVAHASSHDLVSSKVSDTAGGAASDFSWAAAFAPAPAPGPGPAPAAEGTLWAADSHVEEFSNEYQPFTRRKHLHEPNAVEDKRWLFEMREGPGNFDLDGDYIKDGDHGVTPQQRAAKERAYQKWVHPDGSADREENYVWNPEKVPTSTPEPEPTPCPEESPPSRAPKANLLPPRDRSAAVQDSQLMLPVLSSVVVAFLFSCRDGRSYFSAAA